MRWQAKHTSLLVISIGFGVFYILFLKEWMLALIVVCLIGFLVGPVGNFIHITWMQLAKLLGYINSRILLSVIFFVFLTPIALLKRLLQKRSFLLSPTQIASSFESRNHLYAKRDLEQPF